jgi:hypothetical protein
VRHPPGYYEDLAVAAEKLNDWKKAAQHWREAAGASIGHNRRDRYEARGDWCEKQPPVA